jgi:hypothetical protein
MLAVGCVWQLDELACNRKGEATIDPLAGAETVISAAKALVARLERMMENTTTVNLGRACTFMDSPQLAGEHISDGRRM